MNRGLAAAALLCLLCPGPLHAAPPAKRKSSGNDMVRVMKIEPKTVHPGDKITVTGDRLDAISAVLLGKMSPTVVEHTPHRLVFLAPEDVVETKIYKAYVFFLIPGQPLMQTKTEISVVPVSEGVGKGAGAETTLTEDGTLAPGRPKSWPIALEGAAAFEVAVNTTGGEAEAKLEAEGSEPLVRATSGGSLRWRVLSREIGKSDSVTLTISTDAANVRYRAVVTRQSAASKRTPIPKPKATSLR